MKYTILFLTYTDLTYDGRTRELLNVMEQIGDTYVVANKGVTDYRKQCTPKFGGIFRVTDFIRLSIKMARSVNPSIIFIDNRMACIPGLIINLFFSKMKVIQDVRELYVLNEQKRVKGKIGCLIEKKMMQRANIVICANQFRADYMVKNYHLRTKPIVYENIRKLENKNIKENDISDWFNQMGVRKNSKKIISTSGWDCSRTNDELVSEIMKITDYDIDIFLVGGGSGTDKEMIEKIFQNSKLKNAHKIFFIPKLQPHKLKALIDACDIGIVNYGKYDTNNLYCASGKIYEFLYEGKPVVTTDNPPLKYFCDSKKVGVSGKSYKESIEIVLRDYDYYKNEVKKYISTVSVSENNNILQKGIEIQLEQNYL